MGVVQLSFIHIVERDRTGMQQSVLGHVTFQNHRRVAEYAEMARRNARRTQPLSGQWTCLVRL